MPIIKFTLIAAHLKSKVASGIADEQEWREEEAAVLRRIIDARLAAEPEGRLVVLGDFNDTQDSRAMKSILGRGKNRVVRHPPCGAARRERRAAEHW